MTQFTWGQGAVSVSTADVTAKGGGEHARHGEKEGPLERLSKELGLTEDQKTQLKAAFKAQQDAIKSILTPEQLAKWEELKARHREERDEDHEAQNHEGDHWKNGGPIEHLVKELGLTEAQRAQIQALFKAQQPAIKAIRENTSLTPEQKKEQVSAIFEGIKQQIKSILTPEQQQKFAAMKGPHAQAKP